MMKRIVMFVVLFAAGPVLAASSAVLEAPAFTDVTYSKAVTDSIASGSIDYFIQGKGGDNAKGDKTCEDGLFYSDDFLAIFDGATDKSGKSYNGDKGGRVARNIILGVFKQAAPDATPKDILAAINKEYQAFYAANADIDFAKEPLFRPTATLIWYSFARNEVTAIGDSKARIDGKIYNDGTKMVDILNSDLRVKVIKELKLTPEQVEKDDLGRFYIMPLLMKQSEFQNNPKAPEAFQYWAIDGFPIPDEKLEILKLDQRPNLIEFSTDGYESFPAQPAVAEYETELAKLLKDDPLRIKNPSTKGIQAGNVSFDDRAVLIWKAK